TVARGAADVLAGRQVACRRGRAARAGIIRRVWIDTHCHLDAREFDHDRDAVVARAHSAGVVRLVLPAVDAASFDVVRELAHRHDLAYALGIHPLATGAASEHD